MGRPKPNLPSGRGDDTFLSCLVRTLLDAGVDDVVIVVGHEHESVVASFAAQRLPARFVRNDNYAAGQLSSLLAGLSVVDRPGVTAMLVSLVDVPFASVATVRAVIERYRQARVPIVRPARGAEHGHPLIIDRSLFEPLRRADPDAGAKPVVRAHANPEGEVFVDDEGAFYDVDTPEQYERALRIFSVPPSAGNGAG
jgi:molybdenum cofactor cytidylyltransferase